MRNRNRSIVVGLILSVVLVVAAMPAGGTRPGKPRADEVRSANLRLVGATGDNRPAVTFAEAFFTDAAFQDDYAYQGTWNGGFRIVDISRPRKPKAVAEVDCGTFQGDIGVYKNLVFRSIDTPIAATTAEETCDAARRPRASRASRSSRCANRSARARTTSLPRWRPTAAPTRTPSSPIRSGTACSSTSPASGTAPVYDNDPIWRHECSVEHDKFQIVEVPLDDPEDAQVIADVPLAGGHSCHDIGVLLTKEDRLAVCAGMQAVVFDLSDPAEPQRLRAFTTPGVTGWHSAALSWDGDVTVMGWEPGGGVGPECEAGDPALFKSIFFFDTATGALLGTWVLPRAQSAVENCTIHNYNVVPTRTRDVLVAGNYQAGTWVVDFTDPRRATTVAWADPFPLDPAALTLGGAWGSYWYNGFIYQTDITKGLKVYKLKDKIRWSAEDVDRLNPQTQIWPEKRKKRRGGW